MWMNVHVRHAFYAAINYFNIDNNVSIKVWESNYADKYEDLAKLCAAAGDYKTQGKCYAAAWSAVAVPPRLPKPTVTWGSSS